MKRLAILGASGQGRVVADAAECAGWTHIDFYDDGWPVREANGPWKLRGDSSALLHKLQHYDGVIIAIGDNAVRARKHEELELAQAPFATVIHPSAIVSRHASVGPGSVIFAAAVVNIGARIGKGVILNTGCSIDHDCVIDDFAHIGPGAHLGGGVYIGGQSWIGIGASARHLVQVGLGSVVGAGATVICDIPDNVTVAGVPAKPLRQ